MTHIDDCFLILEEKYLFDGGFFRGIFLRNFSEVAGDFGDTFGEWKCCTGRDMSVGYGGYDTSTHIENAPSNRCCSRIDAENAHNGGISREILLRVIIDNIHIVVVIEFLKEGFITRAVVIGEGDSFCWAMDNCR